ncbi:MAG: tRNA adenosine(34) deaminase TadA [Deltaproteobacteria bacterium]|nr:tRNA adenosine(34) deaminase TadA [Deltaproteobacteria bacterium]
MPKNRASAKFSEEDLFFMQEAVKEALKAEKKGDVPIGAVIVKDGRIIGRGHNRKEAAADPTGHAEIAAIQKAAKKLKAWRLTGSSIYVTLEPCLMCMGALVQARIENLIFACRDPKAGAAGSLYDVAADKRLNHRINVKESLLTEEASVMLKKFFLKLRKRNERNLLAAKIKKHGGE